MVKTIKWNKRALKRLREIIDYFHSEGQNQAAVKFVDTIYEKLELIKKQPTIGRPSPNTKTMREFNIDKYRKMYYRINGSIIHISTFFDMRQDPKKRPF